MSVEAAFCNYTQETSAEVLAGLLAGCLLNLAFSNQHFEPVKQEVTCALE